MAKPKAVPSASAPVVTGAEGFGLKTSIYGYNSMKRELKNFDPELRKAMDREIRGTMTGIVTRARSMVPDQPLSGWRTGGSGVWSSRLGWDPSGIKSGIVIRQGGKRSKGSATSSAWSIKNGGGKKTAAGAVYELAGRKSTGKGPAGQSFISALSAAGGRPSRLIWRAWDDMGGEARVTQEILGIVGVYETLLEQSIKNSTKD